MPTIPNKKGNANVLPSRVVSNDTIKNSKVNALQLKKDAAAKKLADIKENRRKLDSITATKRTEIVRKKDSIIQKNANARGLSVSDYKNTVRKESKKPDVGVETCGPNFKSTKCGTSKSASKQSKKDWKSK